MPIKLSTEQQATVQAIGIDTDVANLEGVQQDSGLPLFPAVDGYGDLSADMRNTVKSAVAQAQAAAVRYYAPIVEGVSLTSPSAPSIDNTPRDICSVSVRSYVSRKVAITFSLSGYSSTTDYQASFGVQVNGILVGNYANHFFNVSTSHAHMTHTWVTTVGPGVSNIVGRVYRSTGSGVMTIDASDSVSLTVVG